MRWLESQPLIEEAQERQRAACEELAPGIDIMLVHGEQGVNPASASYVARKERYGREIGADVRVHHLGLVAVQSMAVINELNKQKACNGMMMQLPLPIADRELRASEEARVCAGVDIRKDVDGLAPGSPFPQATPLGLMNILEGYGIDVENRQATVVGAAGKLVGRGCVRLLRDRDAQVFEIDKENSEEEMRMAIRGADLVVSAVGRAGMITPDMLRDGQVVLDAGVSPYLRNDGKETTIGDVDPLVYESDLDIQITPHRGGAGPMTVSALFENLIKAASGQQSAQAA
jgi:methylenetetrahydrofolate dehydrogenase (NADP+)/methenyltetrahydrofolate cyclohydrolase